MAYFILRLDQILDFVSPFLAWGDFQARSRLARSTISEEKWGITRSLVKYTSFKTLSRDDLAHSLLSTVKAYQFQTWQVNQL